jgi:phage-related protein
VRWTVCQVAKVVHKFRDSKQCDSALWQEIRISFALLIEKGPGLAGTQIAEKLSGGDGIWELKAHLDNRQPRLLFYIRPNSTVLVFVHAFLKKGKKDYGPAIALAKQRRRDAERGRFILNAIVH